MGGGIELQNLSNKVQQYLKQNKHNKRYRVFAAVLSFVVAISVFSSLIMPAMSMTGKGVIMSAANSGQQTVVYDGKTFEYVFLPSSADIETSNGTEMNFGDGEQRIVTFKVNFDFGKYNGEDGGTKLPSRFLYCGVSDNVLVPDGGLPDGGWGELKDSTGWEYNTEYNPSGSQVSGRYKIVTVNGQSYIFIEFLDEYYKYYTEKGDTPITGSVEFTANVTRNDDEVGDNTKVLIGGTEIIVDKFEPKTISLEKTGAAADDGNSIEWTVTVTNESGMKLTEISDEMFAEATEVEASPGGIGSYNSESKKFEFNAEYPFAIDDTYTITYTTPIDKNNSSYVLDGKVSNTVTVPLDDNNEVTKSAEVSFDKTTIKKVGSADYKNNTVEWKITVTNPKNADLSGYILRDDAFKNAIGDIVVSDGSGNVNAALDANGRLVFSDAGLNTTARELTVTYTTNLDTSGDNYNEVRLQPPGTDKDNNWTGPSNNATVKNLFTVSKGSNCDGALGQIKWDIQVWQNQSETLVGKVITDDMFADAQEGSIKLYIGNKTVTLDKSDISGGYVIPDFVTADDGTEVNVAEKDWLKLEYITLVEDIVDNPDYYIDNNGRIENTAYLGTEGGDILSEAKASPYFQYRNSVTKSLVTERQTENKAELTWSVTLAQYKGQFKGQTFEDVMSVSDSNLSQEYVPGSFTITYSKDSGSYNDVLPEDMYEIAAGGNGNDSFTVSFKNDDFYDDVTGVQIRYRSEVDISSLADQDKFTVANNAKYNNKETPGVTKEITVDKSDTAPYKKLDGNSTVSGNTVNDINQLEKVTYNGTEYYKLDWKLVINENGKLDPDLSEGDVTLVDKLPEEVILLERKNEFANESVILGALDSSDLFDLYPYYCDYTYNEAAREISFTVKSSVANHTYTICYSGLIPVDTVTKAVNTNGKIDLKNTVQDQDGNYPEVSQTQTVKRKSLQKSADADSDGRRITYTVEVNPNGQDLANGDYLDLVDTITVGDTASRSYLGSDGTMHQEMIDDIENSDVNMELRSVQVRRVNADGTKTVLDTSEYSYELVDPVQNTVSYPVDVEFVDGGQGYALLKLSASEFPKNAVTTLTVTPTVDTIGTYKVFYGSDQWGGTVIEEKSGIAADKISVPITLPATLGSNEYIWIEYTLSDRGWNNDSYNLGNHKEEVVNNVDVPALKKTVTDFVKQLKISVPDEEHLEIVYTYYGSPANPEDAKNDSFAVETLNNVAFATDAAYEDASDDNDTFLELIDQSKGVSAMTVPLKVEKVDAGDYTLTLNAKFKLWKYAPIKDGDEITGYQWVPAAEFVQNGDRTVVTWGTEADANAGNKDSASAAEFSTPEQSSIQLEPAVGTGETEVGYLYMIVETEAPDGYHLDTTPIYFSYRVRPDVSALPEGFRTSDYQFINNNETFRISNLLQSINVTVDKYWSDGNYDSGSATFKLYKSFKKVSTGLPDDAVELNDREYTLTAERNKVTNDDGSVKWTYTWNNLPGCEKEVDGVYKQLYYYVQETGTETDSGKTYTAYYENNGLRKTETVKVTNSADLTILKEWKDLDNHDIADEKLKDISVDIELYQSKTAPNSIDRKNGDNGLPTDCEPYEVNGSNVISLSAENDWKCTVEGLPETDADGEKYYYYALEQESDIKIDDAPNGFSVSIINGVSNTGTIKVTNKAIPQDIVSFNFKLKKLWSDGDTVNHSQDTLTFDIHRSVHKEDIPTNVNTFDYKGSTNGKKVTFAVHNSDGSLDVGLASGASNSFDNIFADNVFSFAVYYGWFDRTVNTIEVSNEQGEVLETVNVPAWFSSVSGEYIDVYGYDANTDWTTPTFNIKLNKITENLKIDIYIANVSSSSNYSVTSTPDPNNSVVPAANAPLDDVYSGSKEDPTYWTTVTLTVDGNWSADITMDLNNILGQNYYYWIEETRLGTTDISSTKYTPYYRYNNDEGLLAISGYDSDPTIEVFNKAENDTGTLPETGGTGTAPYKAAGAAIACTSAVLLVTKRRRTARNKK